MGNLKKDAIRWHNGKCRIQHFFKLGPHWRKSQDIAGYAASIWEDFFFHLSLVSPPTR